MHCSLTSVASSFAQGRSIPDLCLVVLAVPFSGPRALHESAPALSRSHLCAAPL